MNDLAFNQGVVKGERLLQKLSVPRDSNIWEYEKKK
jgi:hypothetical protein